MNDYGKIDMNVHGNTQDRYFLLANKKLVLIMLCSLILEILQLLYKPKNTPIKILYGFSYSDIHRSQDSRGRGRLIL